MADGPPFNRVLVNTPLTGSMDVNTQGTGMPVLWKVDGSGVFYESDEAVQGQDEAWFVDLGGAVPGTPVRINPPLGTNQDVFSIVGQ